MTAVQPVRLQLSRRGGFKLQEHSRAVNGLEAVKVDRKTVWGNPFKVGDPVYEIHKPAPIARPKGVVDLFPKEREARIRRRREGMTAAECVQRFREAAPNWFTAHDLLKLRGRNLACWCALPKPGDPDICHAAVLLEIANRPVCEAVE